MNTIKHISAYQHISISADQQIGDQVLRAEANRAWVRAKIAERGLTEEIQKEARQVAELRAEMEEL